MNSEIGEIIGKGRCVIGSLAVVMKGRYAYGDVKRDSRGRFSFQHYHIY